MFENQIFCSSVVPGFFYLFLFFIYRLLFHIFIIALDVFTGYKNAMRNDTPRNYIDCDDGV